MENILDIKKYPKELKKLEKLTICSNELIGGGDLIKVDDFVPLVIGAGDVPKIWITMKYDNNIIEIVKNNYSSNNQIKIKKDNFSREIVIFAESEKLISAKMINDTECVVEHLDFKPIGLNIYGTSKEINIANTKLSGNKFEGAMFMIGTD